MHSSSFFSIATLLFEHDKETLFRQSGFMELPERVTSDLRVLAEQIEPLKTAVEQLHELLEYVYRNREELAGILDRKGLPETPESIACVSCDADSPASLAAAVKDGWTRLQVDDGQGWNYLGQCVACQKAEAEMDAKHVEGKPEDHPIRDQFDVLKSVVDKANGKPYIPLSVLEKHLLTDQKLISSSGKLTKAGREKFSDLDREKQEATRKDIAREVAQVEAETGRKVGRLF